jgi:hypothetical protein
MTQRGSRPAASARLAKVRRSVCGVTFSERSISPAAARFSFARLTAPARRRLRTLESLWWPPVPVRKTGSAGP